MTVSSIRAKAIAEILWELKKAEKLATLTSIADRAGLSPGAGGRTISTCLKTVRREWPHLQWWRAVADSGQVEKEQESLLIKNGFETETIDGGIVVLKVRTTEMMNWDNTAEQQLDRQPSAAEPR